MTGIEIVILIVSAVFVMGVYELGYAQAMRDMCPQPTKHLPHNDIPDELYIVRDRVNQFEPPITMDDIRREDERPHLT
ncbi:MAG: hypothetical protein HN929_14315 [Chloroflexi bacterium]|jgi:hypothetical protein|nr:hypothetical protein [Chloroflexota bacterium]